MPGTDKLWRRPALAHRRHRRPRPPTHPGLFASRPGRPGDEAGGVAYISHFHVVNHAPAAVAGSVTLSVPSMPSIACDQHVDGWRRARLERVGSLTAGGCEKLSNPRGLVAQTTQALTDGIESAAIPATIARLKGGRMRAEQFLAIG